MLKMTLYKDTEKPVIWRKIEIVHVLQKQKCDRRNTLVVNRIEDYMEKIKLIAPVGEQRAVS